MEVILILVSGPADAGLSKFVDMDKDYFIGRQALLTRGRRHTFLVFCVMVTYQKQVTWCILAASALDTLQPELIPKI